MSEKVLVTEGLPCNFESVRLKLDFYFKNKKKSGGETIKIAEHPDDTRKALLFYADHNEAKNVLERVHQIDFQDLGLVELPVKSQEDENVQSKKVTPAVKPRQKWQPVNTTENQPVEHKVSVVENEDTIRSQSLLVNSTDPIDEDTVTLYFEQFSDHVELEKTGTNSWILKPATQSDLLKILAVKEHDFGLSVGIHNDGGEAANHDSHRFVLTGFSNSCNVKLISLLIGSCSQRAEHTWELLDDEGIVVSFKENINVQNFFSKCNSRKPQGMDIKVSHLELTDSVLVQGDMSQIEEEILTSYFSDKVRSGGADIKSLSWMDVQRSMIITFQDRDAAYQVVEQKHSLFGVDLTVHLFYSRFQKALTGETPTLSDPQTSFAIAVNEHILGFIENNDQNENDLQDQLKTVHAHALLGKTPRKIVLEMTLDRETLAALRVGPTWKNDVMTVTQRFLDEYLVTEFPVEAEVWKRLESSLINLITPEANIFFKQTNSMVVIVGQKLVVNTLFETATNLLKDETADVLEGKQTTDDSEVFSEENISVRSMEEVEFIESCLNLSEIPEIKNYGITIDACGTESSPYLKITAIKENIEDAVQAVKQQLLYILLEKQIYSKAGEAKVLKKYEANIKAKAKELCCNLHLSIEQPTEWGPKKSFTHKISSISLMVEEGELSQYNVDVLICPMTSSLTFDNPIARQFLKAGGYQIQDVCRRFQREERVVHAGDIILSGPGNLSAKTLIYTVLPQSGQPQDYFYLKSAILKSLQKAEETSSDSVAMSVAGCGTFGFSVQDGCHAIREAIVQFCSDHQNHLPNLRNIFVVDSDVKVVDEFNAALVQLMCPASHLRTPKPKLRSGTSVSVCGVQVLLKKGDITKQIVDVIVNSNNRDLNLHIGVSGAVFKAAGESVVNEYLMNGPKLDEVMFTGGGNLSCKYIAQMFGPLNAADITNSMEEVFDLCESKAAATVAIPAIGTGLGGFSAYESISAIFTALENHLTQWSSSSLKRMMVVAFDRVIWQDFQDFFKKRNRKSMANTTTTRGKMPPNQVKIQSVRIEVKKGDIINETVQALVNSTNRTMDLEKGVSGVIFGAAGPSVVKQCQELNRLQGDTVAVTRAGNLQCDFIIHMVGPKSAAKVTSRVKNVLEQCEQQGISTISFPAVGTGRGGVQSTDVVFAMLQAIEEHLSQRSVTSLKLVYVVIQQDAILQAFLEGLKERTASRQDIGENDEDKSDQNSNSSEDDDGRGEAMKQKSADHEASQKPSDELYWDPNNDFDLDNLDCELKNLLRMHGIGKAQLKIKEISEAIYDVLKQKGSVEAVKDELRKPDTECLDATLQMVINMARDEKQKRLRARRRLKSSYKLNPDGSTYWDQDKGFDLDNLDPELRNLFDMCGITEEQLKDKETSRVICDFIEKKGGVEAVKSEFRREVAQSSSQTRQPLSLATETSAIFFPVATVEMYGKSSDDLEKLKTFLDDIISDECTSKEVQSIHLSKLPQEDLEAMVDLSLNNQVQILVLTPDKLTISGKKDDVLEVVLNINSFIQAAKEREIQENEEKRLSKTLCWEAAEGDTWVPLDSKISYQLELAFHKKEQTVTYKDDSEIYTVDLKELKRENSNRASCRIKRTLLSDSDTAIIHPPPTWTKMGGKDLEIIPLASDSDEFKKIQEEFLSSYKKRPVASIQVVKICRIQSQAQWQRYCVLKQAVDKKYPKLKNEHFLYHGTTKEICEKINKNGFNRSFCGRNAVAHGEGTYFAKEAWYSCQDQYSNPDENGLKYIYRARVVTGLPCKSQKGMKEPDPLDPKDPRSGLYDCAVDDLKNPSIFVVFCDAGAYPDYLITFNSVKK